MNKNLNYSNYIFLPKFQTNIIIVYDSKKDQISQVEINLEHFGYRSFGAVRSCSIDSKCFISGGFNFVDNWKLIDHILIYDYNKNTIELFSNLLQSRCCHAMIYLNNYFYFIGGCNESKCERIEINTKKSEWIPNTNYCRAKPVSCIDKLSRIYLMGGDIGNGIHSDSIEILDTNKMDQWIEIKLQIKDPFQLINSMGILNFYVNNQMHIFLFGGADPQCNYFENVLHFNIDDFVVEKTNLFALDKDGFSQNPNFLEINENIFANIGVFKGNVTKVDLNSIKLDELKL